MARKPRVLLRSTSVSRSSADDGSVTRLDNYRKSPRKGTSDSFANFSAQLGISTDNLMAQGTYIQTPITRNRTLIEQAYRGSWICRAVIEAVADDMTREGIDINSEMEPDQIEELAASTEDLGVMRSFNELAKNGRMYGGALGYIMIDGQDPSTPLRLDSIRKGQFKGIAVYDRWMIYPDWTSLIDEQGPDIGKPKYYETSPGIAGVPQGRFHHSRCIRYEGVYLPYFQRLTEMGWGLSVLEPMWDRLLAFDSATLGASQLVFKAHIRTLSIEGLRTAIAGPPEMLAALVKNIEFIRKYQSLEGLSVIDAKDKFETHTYTFAGINDLLGQLGNQLSGATKIPMIRLLGEAPTGLNADGSAVLRTYYDDIKAEQGSRFRKGLGTVLDCTHRSTFGRAPEPSFGFDFRSLWQLNEKERADIAGAITTTVSEAFSKGIIDKPTALKELREQAPLTGVWSNVTDDVITDAENEPPPMPGMPPGFPGMGGGGGEGGGGPEDARKAAGGPGNNLALPAPRNEAADLGAASRASRDEISPIGNGFIEWLDRDLNPATRETAEFGRIELGAEGGKETLWIAAQGQSRRELAKAAGAKGSGETVDQPTFDPPVSEPQRRAMWAAANGRSTLGIPREVGKEFVGDDWTESLHPRVKGGSTAGEFTVKGGGGSVSVRSSGSTNVRADIKSANKGDPEPAKKPYRPPTAEEIAAESTGGLYKPPPSPNGGSPHGYEFVSPNVSTTHSIASAKNELSKPRQQLLRTISKDIATKLGMRAKEDDAIGAWSDGAENTVLTRVDNADWDKLELAAAMKGWVADQKSVLVFQQQEGGTGALYNFKAHGTPEEINKALLEDGVAFHTIVPDLLGNGATIYVADLDGSAHDAVAKAAERYDAQVEFVRGKGEFVGTTKEDGTDRQQRDDARRAYEEAIGKSKVQGSADIWAGIRDRYGSSLTNQEELNRAARVVATQFNYPPEKVYVTPGYRAFQVGDMTYHAAATSMFNLQFVGNETYHKGDIVVYEDGIKPESLPKVLSHEIMHQKFQPVLEAYQNEQDRVENDGLPIEQTSNVYRSLSPFFSPEGMAKLKADDGVTDYSAQYWQGGGGGDQFLPVHETLAEIASIGHGAQVTKQPSENWQKLYDTVNTLYEGMAK